MLADLELLVNTESPSNDRERLVASADALALIIDKRLGSGAEIVAGPAGPHVRWSGGDRPKVLVVGHHDTVFPGGTVAARPFAVADGRATGPGVFDMKAGIVQAVHAIAELADRRGVELLISSDEEVGSGSSRALIEERAAACGAVLVLEPSAEGGALKTGRKGTGTFQVVVRGRASHAGLEPEKGINSLVAAAELIGQIATFGDPATGTTVTPTVVSGGTADNVVPAETRFSVDVRVVEPAEKERLEAAMAALASSVPGVSIEVGGGIGRPPMHESASATLYPLAVAAAARIGLAPVHGIAVGGGSDGNFTAAIGVPTLDGLGAVGGGAHADDEFVLVDTMVERTRLLTALLADICSR
ncbi:MAG: putative carboxypeptidase [Ilumatobacteraceae bacterium]|nr:putative carboxypeptidase [Ilumatobacteraceae bacterium]